MTETPEWVWYIFGAIVVPLGVAAWYIGWDWIKRGQPW